jgi:HEAT repeat protein/S1-C subfamily serine protease
VVKHPGPPVGILAAGFLALLLLGGGLLIWVLVRNQDGGEETAAGSDSPGERTPDRGGEAAASKPGERSLTPEQVYRRLLRSTAWVVVRAEDRVGSGSGSLVDSREGLVMTNHHVVAGSTGVLVFFPAYEGKTLITSPKHYAENAKTLAVRARVVASDPRRDLALLKLERVPPGVPVLPLARESPSPGRKMHSIGASGVDLKTGKGTLWRYTSGDVRQVYQRTDTYPDGQTISAWTVETQSPVNPGDSGGPVVDDRGVLVAVVSAAETRKRAVSMFIDIREVRDFLRAHYRGLGKEWADEAVPELVEVDQLPRLIKELGAAKPQTRARAARALGDLGPEARPAIPALLRAWKAADTLVAQQVARALEKIGPPDPADIGALVAALEEGPRGAKLYCVRTLVRMGVAGRKGLSALVARCRDEDLEVRLAALQALPRVGDAGDAGVVGALLGALRDPQSQVRRSAASGLLQLGKPVRQQAFAPLLAALPDTDPAAAREVERALAALGPPGEEDVAVLAAALKSPAPRLRLFAARSLHSLGVSAKAATAELIKAVGDADAGVRLAAVQTLGQFGADARPAVPALVRALKDQDSKVRGAAAAALGGAGREPGVYPALLRALADQDADARSSVQAALEQLGGPARADAESIGSCLGDDNPLVRAFAADALARLGADAKTHVPELRGLLKDKSLHARLAAVRALGAVGPSAREAAPGLLLLMEEKITPSAGEPAQGTFHKAVLAALEKIGMEDAGAALPVLRKALKDADPEVRAQAASTVGALGVRGKPAVADLVLLFRHPKTQAAAEEALVKMGGEIVPVLMTHLDDRDRSVVLGVVQVLAKLGPTAKKAVTKLLFCRVKWQKDREINGAILEALRVIDVKE